MSSLLFELILASMCLLSLVILYLPHQLMILVTWVSHSLRWSSILANRISLMGGSIFV